MLLWSLFCSLSYWHSAALGGVCTLCPHGPLPTYPQVTGLVFCNLRLHKLWCWMLCESINYLYYCVNIYSRLMLDLFFWTCHFPMYWKIVACFEKHVIFLVWLVHSKIKVFNTTIIDVVDVFTEIRVGGLQLTDWLIY